MPFRLSFLGSLYNRRAMKLGSSVDSTNDNRRSVKWVDVSACTDCFFTKMSLTTIIKGLRGIASFLVLLTHLSRAFDYELFNTRTSENGPIRLLQQPILRLPWQGRLGVTIFAFLTGYVCALKPLKLARAGQHYAAFSAIAKSAFRRPARLILPAAIAMMLAWFVAQFGAFTVAQRCDSDWLRDASPTVGDSLGGEVIRLWRVFLATWTNGHMDYDDHQWALLPLLKGSMIVYVTLVATMYVQFRYRALVYIGMYMYFWQNPAPETGMNLSRRFFSWFFHKLTLLPAPIRNLWPTILLWHASLRHS